MTLIKHIPALQVLIPFFAALFCTLTFHKFTSWIIATIAVSLNLAVGLYAMPLIKNSIVYVFGNWAAPIGIEYRLDYLNSLLLFAHAGYIGVLSTNDLFNLYVFIEISSLATYVLLSKGNNPKALIGAFDYLIMGTIGATLILISIGFFFSITGSLNISDIFNILQKNFSTTDTTSSDGLNILLIAIVFFLVGSILKMAFFPLHFWMIRAYSASAPFILTYISAISSLLGVYMIMRFIYFTIEAGLVYIPISIILRSMAIVAIISCSYLALKSKDIKKIVIYSTALQIGYVFLLLSIWQAKSLLFQLLIIDSINKVGLFTLLTHIQNKTNELNVNSMKQIRNSFVFKCLAALIILFSSGLPITSMFIVKIKIFDLLIQQKLILEFIVLIIASIFGVLYHLKFTKAIFFGKEENGAMKIDTNLLGLIAIVFIHIVTLLYMNEITEMLGYTTSTIVIG